MVSEIIRWQTRLAHMRRTATRDTELAGKTIKQGLVKGFAKLPVRVHPW